MKHRDGFRGYLAAGLTAFLVIACALLLFFLIFNARGVVSLLGLINQIMRPIYYGLVLAFLLLPIHRRILAFLRSSVPENLLRKKKMVSLLNIAAIFFSHALALVAIYLLLALLLPQVGMSIMGLLRAFPTYVDNLQRFLTEFLDNNPDIQPIVISYYNSIAGGIETWLRQNIFPLQSADGTLNWDSTLNWARSTIFPHLTGVVSNVYSVVLTVLSLCIDLLVSLIVSIYLLARKDILAAQSKKIAYGLFPSRWADLIVEEVRSIYRIFSGFIVGKLLDSLIIGLICWAGCTLLHFPYPTLVATIVGVTNIIPFFGPFIGAVPSALLILLVSPIQCLHFIIFIFVLQQVDGNIIGPKILGESTGLASFWVLFSILFFGGLFGFLGMLLGVPVFAVLYRIVRQLVEYKLRRRNLPRDTAFYIGATQPLAHWTPPEEPPPEAKPASDGTPRPK